MLFVTDIVARVIFFIPGVIGNLEAVFRNHQSLEPVCNADTLMDFGIVGNVIACSRICSNTAGCRGFHFDEANSRCWGSNQTRCRAIAGSVFYHKDCGVPPTLINAQVSAGGTSQGITRTYTCNAGHVFRNLINANITCQPDSTWSTASFDCLWDCGPTPTVANAVVFVGDTIENSTGTYTCNTGYVAIGTTTITCQAGSTWTAVAFSCVRDCGTPPVMSYGTVSSGDTGPGSARSYTCDYGYGTTGTATITCQEGTGWSAPTSTCTELVCDPGWHMIELSCYYTPGSGSSFESDVFTARDICHTYNAYLVQLETESESNAVESWFFGAYPSPVVWIGITDEAVEGTWVWMNSSVPATWTDWNSGQPDGGSSVNYCYLTTVGKWHDRPWGDSNQPLCEKSPVPL